MTLSVSADEITKLLVSAHPELIDNPQELAKRALEIIEFFWDESFIIECRRAKNVTRKEFNDSQE